MSDYTVQWDNDASNHVYVQAASMGDLRRRQLREMAKAASGVNRVEGTDVPTLWRCYIWDGKVPDGCFPSPVETIHYWQYPDEYRAPTCGAASRSSHRWEPVDDSGSDADVCIHCGCIREPAPYLRPDTGESHPIEVPVDLYTYRMPHYYMRWYESDGALSSPLCSPRLADASSEADGAAGAIAASDCDGQVEYVVCACHCAGEQCEMHDDTPYNLQLHKGCRQERQAC